MSPTSISGRSELPKIHLKQSSFNSCSIPHPDLRPGGAAYGLLVAYLLDGSGALPPVGNAHQSKVTRRTTLPTFTI